MHKCITYVVQEGGCKAEERACLHKQASIIQSPDDSVNRAAAQAQAERITRSPVNPRCVLYACMPSQY